MPEKNGCELLPERHRDLCDSDGTGPPDAGTGPDSTGGLTDGAADSVTGLANDLIKELERMIAPGKAWAPEKADSALYAPFLWLGQHLAVAIFICVIVVCALTAWQGTPRMRQMGASTGWTLAAIAAMGAIPGAVMLLHKAVSDGFLAAFDSNEMTLFKVVRADLEATQSDPLAVLLIVSALVVALAFAGLVFLTRQLGILAFVCLAPLVLASLARGGDTTALKKWAMRLLGLMFAPFALLLVTPFVALAKGAIVMDLVLLVAADVIMLRMIFHGVPYIGPRVAGAARTLVERHTTNPVARGIVRAGVPNVYEQEHAPRVPRTVDTPGRAVSRDRGVLLAAYGVQQRQRPARLTTESVVAQVRRDTVRTAQITQARREARASAGVVPPVRPASPARPAAPQPPTPSPAPAGRTTPPNPNP
ncbi:hypothetical protein [Streptomyces genisteinicus]|uniref:Uncharacterized protein n=1 Tax=Streptomyces genisteinicus TaxID=2768068 RepID=A0A7H0I5A5_9ACTN|nr:hypothetical protein [Streptomyces genisteinicus]QNP67971.1 hypothetical protein IAG43_33950 [Streptomyces genisteinicus]